MNRFSFPIVLVCVAALAAGCTEARTADLEPPTPVKVQPVEAFSANNGLRYSGSIRPAAQMELAFKNGGLVDFIAHEAGGPIDKGDRVITGAVLARVRQADFQDRLDQATSQLQEAKAGVEAAKAR